MGYRLSGMSSWESSEGRHIIHWVLRLLGLLLVLLLLFFPFLILCCCCAHSHEERASFLVVVAVAVGWLLSSALKVCKRGPEWELEREGGRVRYLCAHLNILCILDKAHQRCPATCRVNINAHAKYLTVSLKSHAAQWCASHWKCVPSCLLCKCVCVSVLSR